MAIAFDAQSSNGKWTTPADATVTWAHTCTGTNRALVVSYCTNQAQNVTGVTYNGVAMTQINALAPGGNNKQSSWGLINPASGANNIVVTFNTSLSYWDFCAVSFTGVNQSTAFGTPTTIYSNSNVADLNSAALVTTVANSWAVDFLCTGSDGSIFQMDSGQTLRSEIHNGMSACICSKLVASPASVQMDVTNTNAGSANNYSSVTVEMFEVAAPVSSSRVSATGRVANTGRVAETGDVAATGRVAASF